MSLTVNVHSGVYWQATGQDSAPAGGFPPRPAASRDWRVADWRPGLA
jgi:hypothetical protein